MLSDVENVDCFIWKYTKTARSFNHGQDLIIFMTIHTSWIKPDEGMTNYGFYAYVPYSLVLELRLSTTITGRLGDEKVGGSKSSFNLEVCSVRGCLSSMLL